jgi:hypothetical protein
MSIIIQQNFVLVLLLKFKASYMNETEAGNRGYET